MKNAAANAAAFFLYLRKPGAAANAAAFVWTTHFVVTAGPTASAMD